MSDSVEQTMDPSQAIRGVGPDVNLPNATPQAQPDVQAPAMSAPQMPGDVAATVNNPTPGDAHVSRWRAVLQGALAGLAGGIPGVVVGAIHGAAAPQQTFRAIGQAQGERNAQFDISQARAANSVAVAAQNAYTAAKMPQEWQEQQNQRGLAQIQQFRNLGVSPIRVIDDSDQASTDALKDLMDQNGGKLPHVYTVHIAGQDGKGGQIAIYSLDQVANSPQAPGIVNEAQGYMNQAPISSELWAKMSPTDRQDAVNSAMSFWNPTPSSSANAQALISRYQSLQRAWGIAHQGDSNFNSVMSQFSDTIQHLQTGLKGWDKHELDQKTALAHATAEQKAEVKEDHAPAPSEEWRPKATADERKKAGLAENIAENSNYIGNLLLKNPNLVGAVAGRFTSVEQLMGTNDPAISGLGTAIHNIAMANSGVHGFRSQEGVKETENLLLNQFKNGPQAIAGALIALTNSTQTFIDIARPEGYKTHSKQGGARKGMRQ